MPKAKNLRYCRQKANLSQQMLANEIGVSKSTVIAWENKKRAIPVPNSMRISEYFGVDYHDFCDIDLEIMDRTLERGAFSITEDEIQSILMFRQLPQNVKKLIRYAIAVAYENNISSGKDE